MRVLRWRHDARWLGVRAHIRASIRAYVAVSATSALLTMGGCGLFHPVGPDYHSAAPVVQPSGNLSMDAGAPTPPGLLSQQPVPGPWWQLYNDAALNTLVEEALQANLDLRVAAAQLLGSQSALDEARADWLPSTSLEAQDERTRSNVYGSPALVRHNAAVLDFAISYEVDLFGRIRRTVEAANASLEAQQFAFAATQVQVVANTVSAYTMVCQSNLALTSAREQVRIAQGQLDVTRRLQIGGATSPLDVTRAQAQLDTQEASLPPLLSQRQSALYSLAVLLGRSPDQAPTSAAACNAMPVLAEPLPTGDGLALLRRRPDVAQAERTLAAATAGIGVATAALYPQVSLGVAVGGEGTSLSRATEASGRTWSFGPMVHWTFPNIVQARAEIRAQRASAYGAMAAYDSAVLSALKEVDTALNAYIREQEHNAALRRTRDADASALSQVQRLYTHGMSPYLDVLDAQRTQAAIEAQLITSAGALASDQVRVFQALGGGWNDAAKRSAVQAEAAARRFNEGQAQAGVRKEAAKKGTSAE